MASSSLTIIPQLITEQYMVELHSPPGRYTIILYLADYVNTLNPILFKLDNNTNPSGFSHIYIRKVLLPHIIHYHHDPTYSSLCIKTFTWLRFMIYTHSWDYAITSEHTEIPAQTGRLETRVPGGASSIPREQHTRLLWQPTSRHIYSGPEGHTDTNNKAGNCIYQGMSHIYTYTHIHKHSYSSTCMTWPCTGRRICILILTYTCTYIYASSSSP